MIDLHNHILPGCDDGSKSFDMSIEMLQEAQRQGITCVVNTVHFQHPKLYEKNTDFDYICSVRDELQQKIIENDIDISIHLGAEVFFNFNLLDILNNKLTTFCNMKYMLIEFQTFQFPVGFEKHLYELAISGITPIIAHPERYKSVQNNFHIIEKLINSGCLMQLDAGSIIGHFGENCRLTAKKMILSNMFHIMGSDAHNNRKRNFCLSEALENVYKLIGNDSEILVNDNPQKVIEGKKIEVSELKIEKEKKISLYERVKKKIINKK